MKLYILEPQKRLGEASEISMNPWSEEYDVTMGLIINAHSPSEARKIAARKFNHGDEGADAWLSPDLSTCKELKPDNKPGVVMRDFNAG